ncbi:MAG: DNA polymerase I [Nitrospirae bacterium]|nr:DNA polymerase I [Nitrospirota bacterium]
MKNDLKEIYLIDGSSFIYRAFFAIRGLSNSKGLPTNAVYGFINMLLKILNEKNPRLLCIAFDPKGPTKRHELYEEYKAQRPKMPDALSVQIPYIHRVTGAFKIPVLVLEGYEADDVIGTVSRRGEADGYDVIIVTGDKDMFQLITPHVRVYDPMKDRFFGEADVMERFGVGPSGVAEVMGLMGDSIDNIPGVTGIGEKTARELISVFGSIENLLVHLDDVKRPKLRSLLQEQGEAARLSRELALINTSLPLNIDYEDFRIKPPDYDEIIGLFRELEFSSLLRHFTRHTSSKDENLTYTCVSEERALADIIKKTGDAGRFSLYIDAVSSDAMTALVKGMGLSATEGEAWYIPVAGDTLFTETLTLRQIMSHLGLLLESEDILKCSHDIKRQMILLNRSGMRPHGFDFDTMIASHLLNPGRPDHSLESIALEHLHMNLLSPKAKPQANGGCSDEDTQRICQRADVILRLKEILGKKLIETDVHDLFRNVEIPLAEVLAEMEMTGIRVNPDILMSLSKEMERDMGVICQRIYYIAGEEFNINSPKQLSSILFNKIGLKPIRKTRTGFSTDEGVLTELALQHELPAEILSYRQLSKLKSTYADALLSLINPDTGRVHTSFSQAVTSTGRLSSSKPNLQNIPVRTEMGQRIREAFVARNGCLLLSADYSQIELRILAHISGDELLTRAFINDEDIHTRTAVEIFGLSPSDVTPEMRRRAKAVNFGIVYGISPYGLASDTGITQQEAKEYIDNYFLRHKGVKSFIDAAIIRAKESGYVTTLLNRRRYVPELASEDNGLRQFGERIAVNTPVQGSAADIIKLAMINIHRRFVREGLRAAMILQVHDELLFEVPEEELAAARDIVIAEMEGALQLTVPLKVDSGVGRNWREAG